MRGLRVPRSEETARRWAELKEQVARRRVDRKQQELEVAGSSELFADMNKQPGDRQEES